MCLGEQEYTYLSVTPVEGCADEDDDEDEDEDVQPLLSGALTEDMSEAEEDVLMAF